MLTPLPRKRYPHLTLRPRAGAVTQTSEITTVTEIEGIGESLGELVVPDAR